MCHFGSPTPPGSTPPVHAGSTVDLMWLKWCVARNEKMLDLYPHDPPPLTTMAPRWSGVACRDLRFSVDAPGDPAGPHLTYDRPSV